VDLAVSPDDMVVLVVESSPVVDEFMGSRMHSDVPPSEIIPFTQSPSAPDLCIFR
jgi:hypothetical protein